VAPTTQAVLVAALLVAIVVAVGTSRRLGPDADWVEVVRAVCLPLLDPVVERLVGGVGAAYEISDHEVVYVVDDVEAFEHRLWQAGYRRNVMSALKTLPDGTDQASAWVLRDPAIVGERMQVDVQVFDDGRVAAHHEPSSALRWLVEDWTVLRDHYRGVGYDPVAGADLFERTVLAT
jgi:hypothetical protein